MLSVFHNCLSSGKSVAGDMTANGSHRRGPFLRDGAVRSRCPRGPVLSRGDRRGCVHHPPHQWVPLVTASSAGSRDGSGLWRPCPGVSHAITMMRNSTFKSKGQVHRLEITWGLGGEHRVWSPGPGHLALSLTLCPGKVVEATEPQLLVLSGVNHRPQGTLSGLCGIRLGV